MAARPMGFVFVFLILISIHQLGEGYVSHAGRGIIVGGSTSGLGGGGGKKPQKVLQSRGRKLPEYGAGGSCSPHGGSGHHCEPNV